MKTILLKFSGPLQSYGTGSSFETRHTDLYPSKSALIGMIAASLGYRRDEDEKITKLNELDFGVRVDQKGNLLRDYHIVKKYFDNGEFDKNYVTNRYYLEDYIFLVAISHKDESFLKKIEDGFNSPYFQQYLGRRSLPPTADFYIGIFEKNIADLLKTYPWQARNWYKKRDIKSVEAYFDSELVETETKNMRKDRVISFSQKNRKFSYRSESKIYINTNEIENSLELIGEKDVFI